MRIGAIITGRTLLYAVLSFFAAMILTPFLWTIYASFVRNDFLVNEFPHQLINYGLSNYTFVLRHSQVGRWYVNSLIVTAALLLGNLTCNTMAGYALARLRFPLRSVIFVIVVATMAVPPQVLFVPIFIIVAKLGWLNSYFGLTIPFLVNPFGVFLMRQYFLNFPNELEDAGKIDGLSHWGIFRRLALPLAGPALATQAIFIFVWNWNSFVFPSIIATSSNMYTLPVGIYEITHTSYSNHVAKAAAGVVLMTIPTVAIFGLLQRHFVRNLVGIGTE